MLPPESRTSLTSELAPPRSFGVSVYKTVALLNLVAIGAYRVLLDVPFRPLERALAAAAISSVAALIALRWPRRRLAWLGDLQVALFAALVPLLALEGAWRLAPGIFPGWLRDRVQEGDIDATRKAVVEYLDESPFVKFRP